MIKFKAQDSLGWNSHLFTFRQDFGADARANRRALTASRRSAFTAPQRRLP
jgi:hypothetical protein